MPASATHTTSSPTPKVIAFDFDGTLTTEDTFVGFMKYYCGTVRWYLKMLPLMPTFLAYKMGRIDRHAVKYAVTRAVFTGLPLKDVQERADSFARDVIPTLIRPEGMTHFDGRVSASAQDGSNVVICSASISPYLKSFFRDYETVEVLACELETDSHGICTGEIAGYNVWGTNKVKKLQDHFRSDSIHLLEAYATVRGTVPCWSMRKQHFGVLFASRESPTKSLGHGRGKRKFSVAKPLGFG